jgi:hypothetical protein
MAVLIEGISVIVRLATLHAKYPGGEAAYQRDCPNATFCADDHLARIGFMHSDDVRSFAERLNRVGFVTLQEGRFLDLAIVDQVTGPTAVCEWLAFGKHLDGFVFAWLAGKEHGKVAIPNGWKLEKSLSKNYGYVPREEARDRLKFLRTESGREVFLDQMTGKEVHIGRTR